MDIQKHTPLLNLRSPFTDPVRKSFFSVMKKPLSKVLRIETLNALYSDMHLDNADSSFIDRAIDKLGIQFSVDGQPVHRIPKSGPIVVVSNHPFGVLEGLILYTIISRVRPDIRIMANAMLGFIPEMKDVLIEVDPFGHSSSAKSNIAGLKASMKWLKSGGLLVVFPAGEVSSLQLKKVRVADSVWNDTIGKIIRKTGSQALPIFFEGSNSGMFQTLGLVHPRLRSLLIPHENLEIATKQPILARIGSVISKERIARFSNDKELTSFLRFRTYLLRRETPKIPFFKKKELPKQQAPITMSCDRHILASEVESLPVENILVQTPTFTVFEARAAIIPQLVQEIGIRREETFRSVGEGTGLSIDIDQFDDIYHHLVLWNHVENEIVGAYRFGLTDKILKEHGVKGLYTNTLFKYSQELLEEMGPALEMGRAFIIPKYQKAYQPLLLLWKGVAAYVVNNPKYSTLFGCISISAEYSEIAREIIMGFIKQHHTLPKSYMKATPKNPPKMKKLKNVDMALPANLFDDIDDFTDLVQHVEGDKSIPVLLRQYLKLGGKVISFNVDPDFSDCLDGLIFVDLLESDQKILARFMGKDQVTRFMTHHNINTNENQSKKKIYIAA